MKAPISWLKAYTKIDLPLKELMWKMTEVGMTTESFEEIEGDTVLNVEVTPNRPDWLSITGIAREIAVIHNTKLKYPTLKNIPKKTANLPITVNVDKKLSGRYVGVTIANVSVKPSPTWLQKRLKTVGLRPINNLVDTTNYVMFELGVPIHVFDYDKFATQDITMQLSKDGEKFTSVDEITYTLPKDCLIIKDKDRVIDLCGIKGGANTGISDKTKNIFIHVPIYDSVLIRKTSQKLNLASDASYIYERGADAGRSLDSIKRTVEYVLEFAGGKVASEIIDTRKQSDYSPRKLICSFNKIKCLLGIDLTEEEVLKILTSLELEPKISSDKITLAIPSFRGDLNIDEDIAEEVARIYGYNNFPKTLPVGKVKKEKIPYYYDRGFELFLKNRLEDLGYVETNTLSLTSAENIKASNLNIDNHIRIDNPVSLESEYLRTSIVPGLLLAIKLNADDKILKLFEYNKVYFAPVDNAKEQYRLSAIIKGGSYRKIKTVLDTLLAKLNIQNVDYKQSVTEKGLWHPIKSGVVEKADSQIGVIGQINPIVLDNYQLAEDVYAMELDVAILKELSKPRIYQSIPKHPAQVEDITLIIPQRTKIAEVIQLIKASNSLISEVKLVDVYENSYTLRVYYQHPNKTLDNKEVESLRKEYVTALKKAGIKIKVS